MHNMLYGSPCRRKAHSFFFREETHLHLEEQTIYMHVNGISKPPSLKGRGISRKIYVAEEDFEYLLAPNRWHVGLRNTSYIRARYKASTNASSLEASRN